MEEAYAVQDAMLAEATGLGLGPLWGCAPRAVLKYVIVLYDVFGVFWPAPPTKDWHFSVKLPKRGPKTSNAHRFCRPGPGGFVNHIIAPLIRAVSLIYRQVTIDTGGFRI